MNDSLYLINQQNKNPPQFLKDKPKLDGKQIYHSEISETQANNIYIRAIDKMISLFEKSADSITLLNKELDGSEMKINLLNELADNNKNIQLLNQHFMQLFSVNKEPNLQTSYQTIHSQFAQIEANNALLFLRKNVQYAQNSTKICHYLKELFTKLAENIKNDIKQEEQSSVNSLNADA